MRLGMLRYDIVLSALVWLLDETPNQNKTNSVAPAMSTKGVLVETEKTAKSLCTEERTSRICEWIRCVIRTWGKGWRVWWGL